MTTKLKCVLTGEEFEITEQDLEFYSKLNLPLPKICPQERLRRRISFRNFRHLYHRNCDATGKRIISMYENHQPFPVYDFDYWWSDKWDARDYARKFTTSKLFFDQYQEFSNTIPRSALYRGDSENCDYVNFGDKSKNCYLVFGCVRNEDCLYGHIVWDSKNCQDCLYTFKSEWCSNAIDIFECYDVHYSSECSNCSESYFIENCINCKNCFLCTNLTKAQYCFMNQQLSEAEYKKQVSNYLPFSNELIQVCNLKLNKLKETQAFYPECFGMKYEQVSGNHIYESRNIVNSFDIKRSEGARNCFTGLGLSNCADISFTSSGASNSAECLTMFNAEECFYSHLLRDCSFVYYSEFCFASNNLFACNGLKRAEYCIFNQQYSKEDYFALKEKIVSFMKNTGEWGEFFPIDISPFAYNEAIVNEYLPLSKEQALARGYRWKDYEVYPQVERTKHYETTTITPKDILYCEATNKPFKLTAAEINYYQRMNLPLPVFCPDYRHESRMQKRARRRLMEGKCQGCQKSIQSANFQLSKNVFCDGCYRDKMFN